MFPDLSSTRALPLLAATADSGGESLPPSLLALPFVLLLGAIAVMPFVHAHWWEQHYPKVSVALGAACAGYYLFWLGDYTRMGHVLHEYVSFLALAGSLYVVAGGIHIRVKGEAVPLANCAFLFVGAVLANVIGTTGASMLLIRPYLHTNRRRIAPFHVVFFIFVVSNVGGCLTPIGDPPLFLGFLKGVPFWWVAQHCWQAWLVALALLLAIFYSLDRRNFHRVTPGVEEEDVPPEVWRFLGLGNLFFVAIILGAIFLNHPAGLREALMIGAAVGSYFLTAREVHAANAFNFHPIKEVAWLFVGIFATMTPVLDYLAFHAPSLGIDTEMKFYWLTGSLSGVLDNAPTYLAFLATALGNQHLDLNRPDHVLAYLADHDHHLVAISLGAVFFGAVTYIGNGPNFMVKTIAEHARVPVPGFFGYVVRYAVPFLLPVLFVVGILFFSRWRLF